MAKPRVINGITLPEPRVKKPKVKRKPHGPRTAEQKAVMSLAIKGMYAAKKAAKEDALANPASTWTKEKIEDLIKKDCVSWCLANQIYLPSAGKVFSLDGHEYLDEPYTVDAPLLVFEKGAQLGFSERAVLKAFHSCLFRLKTGLIYYFPTKGDVTDFSKARFAPLIAENAILQQAVKDTDASNIKRVGRAMLYLRGLRSAISAKSAPADKLVFDEIDEAPPEMVDLARKRLDHSEFQEIEVLSTPTIPDFGVDAWFQLTDQRYRYYKCSHCNKYTCFERDFPDCLSITSEGVKRVCKKCKQPLDLSSKDAVYVADYPDKEYNGRKAIGFRICQLHSPYISLETLWEDYNNSKFPSDFYNSRMAQAYIDASNRLDAAHVLGLCGNNGMDYNSKEPCCIGVDIGPDKHHVVVARKEYGEIYRVIYIGETDWGGLELMLDRYNGTMVMDGMPEPERAREISKKFPYKVWSCFYTKSSSVNVRWDDTLSKVTVYQAQAMDASHAMLQMGKVVLPKKSDVVQEFAKHCHNVARKKVEDEETGDIRYQWIKLGADHYRKAFNFMILAGEKTSESRYGQLSYAHLAGANDDFVQSYTW